MPEQYIKTDQQDQSWVIVDVDHEQKAVAAGPSSENQLDVKLGWGEKKVTVFRYCWKVQGCGKCDWMSVANGHGNRQRRKTSLGRHNSKGIGTKP